MSISRANIGLAKFVASGVLVPNVNPGLTTEIQMTAVLINGGIMGPNGIIEIVHGWLYTNSANDKTPRIRFGGMSGTAFFVPVFTTSASCQQFTMISNLGATNSQGGHAAATSNQFGFSSQATQTTSSLDTTVDQDLVFTAQLEVGSETLSLAKYMIKVWRS